MPMNDVLKTLASEQQKADLPEIRRGDTVAVSVRVVEGNRERRNQNWDEFASPWWCNPATGDGTALANFTQGFAGHNGQWNLLYYDYHAKSQRPTQTANPYNQWSLMIDIPQRCYVDGMQLLNAQYP